MIRLPRKCPIPGYDLSFGDAVVWQGKPWVINSMHYVAADGNTRLASLVRYGDNPEQATEAYAPLDELRVFDDAKPYGHA